MLEINKIHNYNCLEGLKLLDDNSIDCCITSPPYWGLRDYGTATWISGDENCNHLKGALASTKSTLQGYTGDHVKLAVGGMPYVNVCKKCGAIRQDEQIGLEKTPEEYVATMVALFNEVKRALKPTGTLWLNLGDSYNGSGKAGNKDNEYFNRHTEFGKPSQNKEKIGNPTHVIGLKPKDLVGIPWMVAFALRSAGWYLRQDIIWHKPNPMPESVTDRCTKSHEYIFLMAKSQKYYFDAESIQEECVTSGIHTNNKYTSSSEMYQTKHSNPNSGLASMEVGENRNKRDVWTVNTKPYSEAHFATFPEKLIVDMVKAGCPKDGIILDPFMGAGTTAVVARKLNRNFIGIELNPKYITIAEKRLYEELGMFL